MAYDGVFPDLRVLAQKYERLRAQLPPSSRPPPYQLLTSDRPRSPAAALASSSGVNIRESHLPDADASPEFWEDEFLKEYYEDKREALGTIEAKDKEGKEETEGLNEDKPEKVRGWVGRKFTWYG